MTPGASGATGRRVALVCPYSLSRPGGVQGQVLGLARSLGRLGDEVTVFAPVDRPEDAPEGLGFVDSGHSVSLRANGSMAPVSVSPAAAVSALKRLRSFGPDVVHIHEPFAPGLPYALLAARDVPPLVGTFHRSGGSVLYSLLSPVTRPLARRLAVRCAVSEAAATTAATALGGTFEVLFNGIETDRFEGVEPWPTDGPTALFLGRHEERKGLAVLLEAWPRVVRDGPARPDGGPDGERPPVLWVAGDGPDTDALKRRHPESATVRWLGVVGEEEKVRRLVAADVLAAPALGGESFGMVLLEAMAARTVVVASDIDGYRDAAGGRAVLAAPGDPSALAGALSGVIGGDLAGGASGRDSWLEAGAARAARWSMADLAGRYDALYTRAMVGVGS
ncbi:MAG TPA: glycosyltransferase family 4 protein [Acidimicrobiales bacterium]